MIAILASFVAIIWIVMFVGENISHSLVGAVIACSNNPTGVALPRPRVIRWPA
ncbi:hypothetical protein ACMGDM_15395 [Sphingomonas sp. DT-51]|uniref:hypothetical protein n=1 Tax=Sphingomonas sp. DT-51 TaxID=3396165 RepID=UPI003F1D257B